MIILADYLTATMMYMMTDLIDIQSCLLILSTVSTSYYHVSYPSMDLTVKQKRFKN